MIEKNLPPVEAAVVIYVKDGKLLTIRHKAPSTAGEGVTGYPGGHLGYAESARHSAKRELYEETGFTADEDDLLEYPGNRYSARLNFQGAGVRDGNMTVFICRKVTGEMKKSYKGDPQFISVRDFQRGLYETLPNVLQAFEDAKQAGELENAA